MLVDHDAVIMKRFETVAIEFFCEQAFARTERIGGIDDDEVILIHTLAHVFQTIGNMNMHTWIVKTAGCLWQPFTADGDDTFIDFYHVNMLHFRIACQFTQAAAVTSTDHQHLARIWVHCHWHMHDHFVINKLILLGQHHDTI